MRIKRGFYFFNIIISIALTSFTQVSGLAQSLSQMMSDARSLEGDSLQIANLEKLLIKPEFHKHQDTFGLLNYYIAYRYRRLANQAKVKQFSAEAIKAFQNDNYLNYQYPTCLLMRGKSNLNLGEIDAAIRDFEFIINNVPISGRGYQSLYEAYQRRAVIYRMQGDYESAIHYLNSFITSTGIDSINQYGQASIYRELSLAYSKYESENKLRLANEAVQKAIDIYSNVKIKNDFDLEQKALNIMHQAFINWELDDLHRAKSLYSDAVELLKDKPTNLVLNGLMTISMRNISEILLESQDCLDALRMIKKADDLFFQKSNPKYIETESGLFLVTANCHFCLKNYQQSLNYLKKGELLLLKNEKYNSAKSLEQFPYKDLFIRNKIRQLFTEFKLAKKDVQSIALVNKAAYIDSLIGFYLEDMYFNSSKIELKNELDDFYKLALDISFNDQDLDKFWYYSEQRSNILLLKNQRFKEQVISPEMVQLENDLAALEQESSELENMLYFLRDSTEIETKDSIASRLIQMKSEQLALYEKRSNDSRINTIQTVSLSDFKTSIQENTSVLHYQFGADSMYVLKIDEEQSLLKKIGRTKEIKDLLADWFSLISDENDLESDLSSVDVISDLLYRSLIEPVGRLKAKVVIIPDEELSYLSFDALKNSNNEYLIREHIIRFDLSGTLMYEHTKIKTVEVDTASAFLPTYRNSELAELSNSVNDVKSLQQTNNLIMYSDAETSRPLFMKTLQESDLVHFGGHAILVDEDNQYSHLALIGDTDDVTNVISLGDLYSMNNISSLIALPACNTGAGSLLQGEGISSLARGFFYAGANSVISSLWSVNDRSTSQIMDSFYTHLESGHSTSEALRLAKLNYLETAPDFLKHPYMWSGLILTGSDSIIEFSNPIHFLIKLALALVCMLTIGYFIISRSKST